MIETPPKTTAKTFYALRRASDHAWVDLSLHMRTGLQKYPTLLATLTLAIRHRMKISKGLPNFGGIEIVTMTVSTTAEDILPDDVAVQQILEDIGNAADISMIAYGKVHAMEAADALLTANQHIDMQYFVIAGSGVTNDDRSIISPEQKGQMRGVADFVNQGPYFLIRDHTSLSMLMLFDGFIPVLIYDIHKREVVL